MIDHIVVINENALFKTKTVNLHDVPFQNCLGFLKGQYILENGLHVRNIGPVTVCF